MKKRMKSLLAITVAVGTMLGSTVMASASTMYVYVREWTQTNTSDSTVGTISTPIGTDYVAVATDVTSTDTYQSALTKATGISTDWNAWGYLTSLSVPKYSYSKTNQGDNYDAEYDDDGNMVGAIWKGDSWMWYPGNNLDLSVTKYPQTTLADTVVPSDDSFSIVLSYDHSEFAWGTKAVD